MKLETGAKHPYLNLIGPLILLVVFAMTAMACSVLDSGPYEESFDAAGSWGVGASAEVEGQVTEGVYEMLVESNQGVYYASAGENFADGAYEVDATQIEGPLNNGYGLLFRVDEENDSFYVFEVSGDGYVWIGYCTDLCESEAVALVGGDWFRSPAVKMGLHETNKLKVVADGDRMTFFVNGLEVGRANDSRLAEGDVAVMVETLGEPGVRVVFDNFSHTAQ
jgi:hypothetical protein